jgi:hypothetical protein
MYVKENRILGKRRYWTPASVFWVISSLSYFLSLGARVVWAPIQTMRSHWRSLESPGSTIPPNTPKSSRNSTWPSRKPRRSDDHTARGARIDMTYRTFDVTVRVTMSIDALDPVERAKISNAYTMFQDLLDEIWHQKVTVNGMMNPEIVGLKLADDGIP